MDLKISDIDKSELIKKSDKNFEEQDLSFEKRKIPYPLRYTEASLTNLSKVSSNKMK